MLIEQARKGELLEAVTNDVKIQLNGNLYMQISHCLLKNHYISLDLHKSLDLRRICFSVYKNKLFVNGHLQVRRF